MNYDELRAKATAATAGGPWGSSAIRAGNWGCHFVVDEVAGYVAQTDSPLLAEYIAAVSPDVVLGLLDELRQIGSLFICKSCKRTPADPLWKWTNWDDPVYRGNHYYEGEMPDLCGPVVLNSHRGEA